MSSPGEKLPDGIRGHLIAGTAAVVVLAGGLCAWAATTDLAGAVIAPGKVVVEGSLKKVQHPTGGVVSAILAKDGDHVERGQMLMRLDDTITKANLRVIRSQLEQLTARALRLRAERDGSATIEFASEDIEHKDDSEFQTILVAETVLFQSRVAARSGEKSQLRERVNQLNKEIEGLIAQKAAKDREIDLVHQQLQETESLWQRNLTPLANVVAIRREAARIEGEQGQLTAAEAQSKAKIAETNLQIIQIDQDARADVMKDLRETEAKIGELSEKQIAAQDQLSRVDIRSPASGIVDQSNAHTVGGVVSQGETIMVVMPVADDLMIEGKVAPQDIDHVFAGQAAIIRFPAFDQRTTPEFHGTVYLISTDLTREQPTEQPYYLVRVGFKAEELKRAGGLTLKAGMPAELFLSTPSRTVASYLIKPLSDQINRVFKD